VCSSDLVSPSLHLALPPIVIPKRLPARMHHYAWVKTETVVQINLEGPFDITCINPAEDPMKKPAATTSQR
jgi:hypothetical protein